MKIIYCLLFVFCAVSSFGQNGSAISVMDFVKIKNDKKAEVLYYYENNWKIYREMALKKEVIISYRILTTTPDSTSDFDLIMITEYADSSHFNLAEERFQKIIKEIRPNGPILLNEIKPADFRQNILTKTATYWIYNK